MVKQRIESIDLLRGVIMVIMALDHVRDFFHIGSFTSSPTDLETTTPILFFTRFITNYCAPTFVFLAGASAFLYGSGKTKKQLFTFLFTRGLWLVFTEIFVINLLWSFNVSYDSINLQVIWAIGISMIVLSLLIYLPKKILLTIGILIVFGHDFLDDIEMKGTSFSSIAWYILHQSTHVRMSEHFSIGFFYPVLPWIGVMTLGYCFGTFYSKAFDPNVRKKWLLRLGLGSIVLFILFRGFNCGDPDDWSTQKDALFTFLSFIKVSKYPPSTDFVLITLGPALLFLYFFETTKNKITDFFLVFGRVPFFYYILHVLFIHGFALLALAVMGGDWRIMIFTEETWRSGKMETYGYHLWIVYLVWIGIVLLLYPFCKKYMIYKANNRDKWWLSYL